MIDEVARDVNNSSGVCARNFTVDSIGWSRKPEEARLYGRVNFGKVRMKKDTTNIGDIRVDG
jgi:hypothetical protein